MRLSLLCLAHLPPVSIGVQAEVTNRDLTLVGNMRGHPGDKLQGLYSKTSSSTLLLENRIYLNTFLRINSKITGRLVINIT
jgi:hypothetical protein